MANVHRTEHFAYRLEPLLGEHFDNVFKAEPSLIPKLASVRTADGPYIDDFATGGFAPMRKFTGTLHYDKKYEGYKKIYEFPEYAGAFSVERKLYDDNMLSKPIAEAQDLAQSAFDRRELDFFQIFNYAESATAIDAEGNTVASVGADGQPLVSASHPSPAYEQEGEGPETRSNRASLALTDDNLHTVALQMRKYLDDRGNPRTIVPTTLLVGYENYRTAWELITADGKIGTADNDPNIHHGIYRLVVSRYLDDSDGRWFLIDDRYAQRFLKWWDRIPVEFATAEAFDEIVAKFRAYGRWEVGWSHWSWVYGSIPA